MNDIRRNLGKWAHLNAFVLLSFMVVFAAAAAIDDSAKTPAPREGAWKQMHESFLKRAKSGPIDLLFIGDSITQGWNNNTVWERHYGPRNAANFGIGGDRTQHVLWRLDNGEADGISPKVVVLMIGTNNIGGNSADEIAGGIKAIVERLRGKLPNAKVLLLGVFPRGDRGDRSQADAAADPRVDEINQKIKSLDDGKAIKYLDIGKSFLTENGRVPKSLMPDFLHLSESGYRAWADAIEPVIWEMMTPAN